ncbi:MULTISPECIES: hypothetical protein [unclassified Pseudactinotalea]|uniref:hypothetical protein n=1 Tax=unclassified Pseudactinotalea TaxID=2649176 RepID=UPI00128D5C20|nr:MULTISPECIES: hypothetical protein [unclassified Pseudactinotalea]MPV50955.1 hypothetical protein [Pseudactinotalea sp. HY160]QGH70435.1 hypothetical protein GCE65_13735 [Pseudactinotalea sp. HY158]
MSALDRLRALMAEAEDYAAGAAPAGGALDRLAARSADGSLGPQWARLAPRLARGETTAAAVFAGEDASPEAVTLRARAGVQLGRLDLAEIPPADEELERELAENWAAMVAARKALEGRAHG